MTLIYPDSLGDTLDAMNQTLFTRAALTPSQREQAARWIAGRQGQPHAYAGMPAPTARDFETGATVFTGERIRSRVGTAHILGEEACRILILLHPQTSGIREVLKCATEGMEERLSVGERSDHPSGTYCCGTCSCAYWRHLAAGGLSRNEERLAAGMNALKLHRRDTGRWHRFTFFYTLLALVEMAPELSRDELRFAAPVCERYVKSRPSGTPHAIRRRHLAAMVLARA